MEPTRAEVLAAWMTLVKIRETYAKTYGRDIDASDDQFLLAALKLVDQYQHKLMLAEELRMKHKG
jgi:hypothetical protein